MQKEISGRALVLLFVALLLAECTAAVELVMTFSALPARRAQAPRSVAEERAAAC